MVEIKNVAVVGASGSLGTPVLKAIVDSGKFNVTVLTRAGSSSTFPSSVKTASVDYASLEALTAALKGQDAVVSTVGAPGLGGQNIIFDAAVAAGVKHFIPSEFGSDLAKPIVAALPIFAPKVAFRKYIEEKIAAGANITYTYVINSAFLDWGIDHSFILNWKGGKPEIFDGGDQLFSSTSLASVGTAVVGVLTHVEETKNRSVYIEDIQISQNQLLALAKKVAPKKTLEPVPTSIAEIIKFSNESMAKGEVTLPVLFNYLFQSICGGKEVGQPFPKNDNELLGLSGKTEADVEAYLKHYLA